MSFNLSQLETIIEQWQLTGDNNLHSQIVTFYYGNINSSHINTLKQILENSQSQHTLSFTCIALKEIIAKQWCIFDSQMQRDLYQFVILYLNKFCQKLNDLTMKSFVRLTAFIFKTFFIEQEFDENFITMMREFIDNNQSLIHVLVAFNLMNEVIAEIQSEQEKQERLRCGKCKRVSEEFRENVLPRIIDFPVVILLNRDQLDQLLQNQQMLLAFLKLVHSCLNYDFIDLNRDNYEDLFIQEHQPLLLPIRALKNKYQIKLYQVMKDLIFVNSFFEIFQHIEANAQTSLEAAILCLKIIADFCRINLKYFEGEEQYIPIVYSIIKGMKSIILGSKKDQTQQIFILQNQDLLFETCNTVSKTLIPIGGNGNCLIGSPEFKEWLFAVHQLTTLIIENNPHQIRVIHNLLEFWSYFSYFLNDNLHQDPKDTIELQGYIQDIIQQYINTKLNLIPVYIENAQNQENPLADYSLLEEHLRFLCHLGFSNIVHISTALMGQLESLVNQFMQNQSQMTFHKLIWIVHLLITFLFGHLQETARCCNLYNRNQKTKQITELHLQLRISSEETRSQVGHILGQFLFFVHNIENNWQIDQLVDSELMIKALTKVYSKLAKTFFGEIFYYFSFAPIYTKIASVFNTPNENIILNLLFEKVCSILQKKQTAYFDIANNIMSIICSKIQMKQDQISQKEYLTVGGLLLEDAFIQNLYQHHCDNNFKLIYEWEKQRCTLYESISSIVFYRQKCLQDIKIIDDFFQPFQQIISLLYSNIVQSQNVDQTIRKSLLNLVYDFLGIVRSIEHCTIYNHSVITVIMDQFKFAEICQGYLLLAQGKDIVMNIAILKFLIELFDSQKCNRLIIQQNSDIDYKLFKIASQLLQLCCKDFFVVEQQGRGVLNESQIYQNEIRPASYICQVFFRLVQSKVLNLSLQFRYQDKGLLELTQNILQIALITPLEYFTQHWKRLQHIQKVIELISNKCIELILMKSNSAIFQRIMAIMYESMQTCDWEARNRVYNYINNLLNFAYSQLNPGPDTETHRDKLKLFLKEQGCSQNLNNILKIAILNVIRGDTTNFQKFSEAVLGLILVQQDQFIKIADQLCNSYSQEKQVKLQQAFLELQSSCPTDFKQSSIDQFVQVLKRFAERILL